MKQKDAGFILARVSAMTVKCAYCGADVERECFDPQTGYVLENQPAHMRRLQEVHAL